MTGEREFTGFVLPFATGIFLATGPALITMTYFPATCTASLAATGCILMSMMHPSRLRIPSRATWILLILLGLSAGVFMGSTSLLTGYGSLKSAFILRAEGLGRGLGEFIDRIPFGDSRTNALMNALITGERTGIPESVTDAFRDSGAAHILSLSGFHIGIVYAIVRSVLSGLGNSLKISRLRSGLTVLLCGFYTLATGAGPSIVRAFLFILLGETARVTHRRRSTATLLFSALFIQLVLSPSSIRSVSFQLSYAAMFGIAYIYPRLRSFWPEKPSARLSGDSPLISRLYGTASCIVTGLIRRIWNSAALSIACQLTTGPLAYIYFESFPRHFLLTNLIALPLTSMLIPAGLIVLLMSYWGFCPQFLLDITDFLTRTLTSSLEIIADM